MTAPAARQAEGRGREGAPIAVALLGAPVAWAAHLGACYVLVAMACGRGWGAMGTILAAATLLFGALAAASGVVAWRGWRRNRAALADGVADEAADPRGTLHLVGIVLAAIFLLLILAGGLVPVMMVPRCD